MLRPSLPRDTLLLTSISSTDAAVIPLQMESSSRTRRLCFSSSSFAPEDNAKEAACEAATEKSSWADFATDLSSADGMETLLPTATAFLSMHS